MGQAPAKRRSKREEKRYHVPSLVLSGSVIVLGLYSRCAPIKMRTDASSRPGLGPLSIYIHVYCVL